MITREEKNKKVVNELKKEQAIKISKKIFQIIMSLFITFLLIFAYIYFIGVKGLKTNEFVVKSNLIPQSFHGMKILHFTDLFYGKTIFSKELDNIQKEINEIKPDLVFFTGNLISNDYQLEQNDIQKLNSFFKEIPYTIGKYAIEGDNDTSNFNLILENTDFTILNNEINTIYYGNKEYINIVGLNDTNDKEININNENYTISLINNYDKYEKYNLNSNLVLAGHHLGGEIRLFNYPLIGNSKYKNNYYQEKDMEVYISSGLGTLHHLRFMNRPSMNVYRLYKSNND